MTDDSGVVDDFSASTDHSDSHTPESENRLDELSQQGEELLHRPHLHGIDAPPVASEEVFTRIEEQSQRMMHTYQEARAEPKPELGLAEYQRSTNAGLAIVIGLLGIPALAFGIAMLGQQYFHTSHAFRTAVTLLGILGGFTYLVVALARSGRK